MSGGGLLFHNT